MGSPRIRETLRTVFSIDLRSLALFRICLGALLLLDLADRTRVLRVLYTDDGFFHKQALLESFGPSIRWTSLHYHTGSSVWLQGSMFLLAAVFAAMLTTGYRTRLATIVSWVLFISLNRRVPASLYGYDEVMRLMLLWSIFLPLGARWSLDSRRKTDDEEPLPTKFVSPATAAILLQVCYVYFFTAIWKIHPDWMEGRAIRIAFETLYTTRDFTRSLAEHAWITVPATYATLAGEFLLPLLALSPWRNSTCRIVAILGMWGLHLGIFIFLRIAFFPPIAIVYWMLFIPSSVWDRGEEHASYFASRKFFENSKAAMGVVVVMLIMSTLYNILGLPQMKHLGLSMPRGFERVCQLMRIDQGWRLYAPTPKTTDGWYIMPAQLANGTTIDAWSQKPPTFAEPEDVQGSFRHFRICMLFMNTVTRQQAPAWPWILRSVVRDWNASHPEQKAIKRAQLAFIYQTSPGNRTKIPLVEIDAATHQAVPIGAPIGVKVEPNANPQ